MPLGLRPGRWEKAPTREPGDLPSNTKPEPGGVPWEPDWMCRATIRAASLAAPRETACWSAVWT